MPSCATPWWMIPSPPFLNRGPLAVWILLQVFMSLSGLWLHGPFNSCPDHILLTLLLVWWSRIISNTSLSLGQQIYAPVLGFLENSNLRKGSNELKILTSPSVLIRLWLLPLILLLSKSNSSSLIFYFLSEKNTNSFSQIQTHVQNVQIDENAAYLVLRW